MGALPKQTGWTAEEFAAWASGQEMPYEFDGVQPQMMVGSYWPHDEIAHNIIAALRPYVAGTRYKVQGLASLIHTVGEAARAPDVFVAPRIVGRPQIRFIPEPLVVFEVVSGATQRDRDLDYKVKLAEYEAVPSILRYVIVEKDEIGYAMWWREQGNLPWTDAGFERTRPIPVPELGCSIPLEAVYAELDMIPPA